MENELISPWTLYWILRLDAIHGLCNVLQTTGYTICSLTTALVIIGAIIAITDKDKNLLAIVNKVRKYLVPAWFIPIIATVLYVLIPTTKQAAVIYAVPTIVNSPTVQEETGEIYVLCKDWFIEAATQTVREGERLNDNIKTEVGLRD